MIEPVDIRRRHGQLFVLSLVSTRVLVLRSWRWDACVGCCRAARAATGLGKLRCSSPATTTRALGRVKDRKQRTPCCQNCDPTRVQLPPLFARGPHPHSVWLAGTA